MLSDLKFPDSLPACRYCDLGIYTVFSVGILTLFYSSLLSLANVFLDPLDNEGEFRESFALMDLAVLIRESNGASTRFMKAASILRWTSGKKR
jgi:hypothetical protein